MNKEGGVLPFLTARRKSGWLTILPQGGEVTLVHVVRQPGYRPEVCLLDVYSVEGGERESLQRLRKSQNLKA
jgi:hypothetical protein